MIKRVNLGYCLFLRCISSQHCCMCTEMKNRLKNRHNWLARRMRGKLKLVEVRVKLFGDQATTGFYRSRYLAPQIGKLSLAAEILLRVLQRVQL